jgi:long-chain acyl-CoA synthetase
MNDATIFTVFSRTAGKAGLKTALTTSHGSWTFQKLHEDTLRLAGCLAEGGERDAVTVLTPDPKDFLTAFFGCAAAGRAALILDPGLPACRVREIAGRHRASLFAVDAKFAPEFADQRCFVFGEPLSTGCRQLPPVESEAEFYWGLTSGTTADPKLFARSHRSWLESFAAAERVFNFPMGSRILIPGPLNHSLFLYGAVHALCRGHTVIAPGAFRPDRVAMAARTATHAYLVPSMLSELLSHGFSDAGLQFIFSGGAKLTAELRKHCETCLPDVDLVEFYGASESSFISAHSTRQPAPSGSVGRAFPGVNIQIRDEAGAPAFPGAEGEIHVSSRMLFSRYIDGAHCGEWFTAGDMGFMDGDGCLHLTGRKNRIINSRALKIRPEPIEQVLLELPAVRRAAVVDLPDPKRGAIAVAAVEFHPGEALTRRALSQHCRTKLGIRSCPHRYYGTDTIPLTRNGKIAFAALREGLLAAGSAFHELR